MIESPPRVRRAPATRDRTSSRSTNERTSGPDPALQEHRDLLKRKQSVLDAVSSMHASARRVVPSTDLAWDAVQDTLVRVWRKGWLPCDPIALRRLARLAALQIDRARRRREDHELVAVRLRDADTEPQPVRGDDLGSAVDAATRALPEPYRTTFRLFADEPTYAGLASALGVPIGTVRSRLSRARSLLHQLLPPREN